MPFQCLITPETAMKDTKDTVTISEIVMLPPQMGQTVQLKDADANELQPFIVKMLAAINGKSVKYCF